MGSRDNHPVIRLADPHAMTGENEWKPEDAEDRYKSRHVVLEQKADAIGTHKVEIETNRVDLGIYHDSFGISTHHRVYYKSGRMREDLSAVYIPLDDHETLIAIRDLIDKALELEPEVK